MSRSLIGENQVIDHDFLSEDEFAVASGVLQSQIDTNHAHVLTTSGNPHNVALNELKWQDNTPPGSDINDLESFLAHTLSTFSDEGFDLIENGDGTVTIASGTAILRDTTDVHTSDLKIYNFSGGTTGTELDALIDNATNYICADYNNNSPKISILNTLSDSRLGFTVTPLYFVTRVGNDTHVLDIRGITLNFACSNTRKDCFTKGFEHVPGGTVVSEDSPRYLNVTAGTFFYGSLEYNHPVYNTKTGGYSYTRIYRNGSEGWTRNTGIVQLDNTYYDDGTGVLHTLSNNNYGVRWLYLVFNNPSELFCLLGRQNNSNISTARLEALPSTLPPELGHGAILIAKMIIQEGASSIYEIQSPFTQVLSYGSPTTHNGLSDIQGGAYNDYYHLTNSQYTALTDGGITTLHSHPTQSGTSIQSLSDVSNIAPQDGDLLIYNTSSGTYIPQQINTYIQDYATAIMVALGG